MNETTNHHIDKIPLSGKTPSIKIPVWLVPILITGLITAGSTYALLNWRMGAIEKRTDKLEAATTENMTSNVDIKNDLKWIKESLGEIKKLLRK